MSKPEPIAELPTADETRAALERIVLSEIFRSSPQLAAFLSFVVEAVLHGKSDRIKGYTIGVEVLRRDIKFDPQLDPIVRVEATRLRRALERYYTGPGQDDPVIIDLPRGSYVPTLRRRGEILDDPDSAKLSPSRRRDWFAAAGVLAVIAVAVVWFVLADRGGPDTERLRPGNGMPTLMVESPEVAGNPDPRALSAPALGRKLRDTFSRFDAIKITDETPPAAAAPDYRLRTFVEYLGDGTTSVQFSLLDVSDGNVVWARVFSGLALARDHAAHEDSIAGQVATTLLQPFGIVRSRERTKLFANGTGDPRYRCLLLTSDAFRSFEPAEYVRARACLERLIAIDLSFGDGFSYLASLLNRQYVYGFGAGADKPATLDDALQLARRGIEINPNSARAWQVLSTVLFCHDIPAAFSAVQKALSLNQYDLIIVGEYGGRLITTGEIERGMNVLRGTMGDGDVRPSWHHFYLFLGNYMLGNLPEATHEADEMTSDAYTHGLFARALTAAANGGDVKARAIWSKLVTLRSAWQDDPRGELDKYIFAKPILDRLVRDLTASGLARGQ